MSPNCMWVAVIDAGLLSCRVLSHVIYIFIEIATTLPICMIAVVVRIQLLQLCMSAQHRGGRILLTLAAKRKWRVTAITLSASVCTSVRPSVRPSVHRNPSLRKVVTHPCQYLNKPWIDLYFKPCSLYGMRACALAQYREYHYQAWTSPVQLVEAHKVSLQSTLTVRGLARNSTSTYSWSEAWHCVPQWYP